MREGKGALCITWFCNITILLHYVQSCNVILLRKILAQFRACAASSWPAVNRRTGLQLVHSTCVCQRGRLISRSCSSFKVFEEYLLVVDLFKFLHAKQSHSGMLHLNHNIRHVMWPADIFKHILIAHQIFLHLISKSIKMARIDKIISVIFFDILIRHTSK